MSESLAEAAGIAATARDRYDPAEDHTPAGRKAFVAGAACAIALVAIGLVVAKLGSKPHATPAPAAPAPAAQFSQAVTDQVAAVESDFEQDNFRKAQADIRKLQELAPEHPRLRFFVSLLDRNLKTHAALAARQKAETVPTTARSEAAAASKSETAARKSEIVAVTPSSPANAPKSGSPRKAVAAIAAPTSSGTRAGTPPNSEDGPVFVAGAPTSSEPLLRPASALPDTSAATPATSVAVPSAAAPVPATAVTASTTTNASPSASRAGQSISDTPPAASARPAPVVTVAARLTQRVPPQYPDSALRSGIQGYVDVHFTITTDGTVANIAVVSSEPADVFDRAATDAVRRWRYEPRVVDGRPVESQSQVRLQFKLAGPGTDSSLSH